jgi:hypothetical protein
MVFNIDEISKQVEQHVQFGFDTKEEIFGALWFYEWGNSEHEQLRKVIDEKYEAHQTESLAWKSPTDFDRLSKAFDGLIKTKIVCLHKAGYTQSDSTTDCWEAVHALEKVEVNAIDYCFYHTQDLIGAIDPHSRSFYLSFGSCDDHDGAKIDIAKRVIGVLSENGLDVYWDGSLNTKIEIKNIDWKKAVDGQNWKMSRVMKILEKDGPGSIEV